MFKCRLIKIVRQDIFVSLNFQKEIKVNKVRETGKIKFNRH